MVELLLEKGVNANYMPYAVDDKPFSKRVERIVRENKLKSMFVMMRGLPLDYNINLVRQHCKQRRRTGISM